MVNRLIIIGNGFDLAHGLRTSYKDFITHYFESLTFKVFEDEFFHTHDWGNGSIKVNSLKELKRLFSQNTQYFSNVDELVWAKRNSSSFIFIKNKLFHSLCELHIDRWVDIEAEYYRQLLVILDMKGTIDTKNNLVASLNLEMDAITRRFDQYLKENVVVEIKNAFNSNTNELFKIGSFYLPKDTRNYNRQFSSKYHSKLNDVFKQQLSRNFSCPEYLETRILNFNYTDTAEQLYASQFKALETINIHGSVSDLSNPLNLGFGDEKSHRYKEIEDINNNEYLRLMKSVAYSNTDNYRRLFDFIESGDFQVQIMGHSCGISDRTLLNAIFENHNCKSIKVFYHQWENDRGQLKDNFSEIVQNISRHFDQKLLMRERIVNKTLCAPLPQKVKA